MPLFPGAEKNLVTGPVRVLRAPTTVALPTRISDVIDVVDPYNPKVGWIDFGLTTDETEYERDMDSEEYEVEQRTGAVLEKITGVTRTLTVPVAEITPEHMKLIEEGSAITTLAAAINKAAEKVTDVGSIETLTRNRVAFIAMRDPGLLATADLVTEPGGKTRGSFIGYLGYQAALAAEGSSMAIGKGDLVGRGVTFRFFPEPTITDPKIAIGRYAFEQAGTISAV